MEIVEFFPYSWNTYEENDTIGIRIFGLNKKNETVFVLVNDFKPYIYVELPEYLEHYENIVDKEGKQETICNKTKIPWKESSIQALSKKMDELAPRGKQPVQKLFQMRKKLYYAKKDRKEDGTYVDKVYPFLKCYFSSTTNLKNFVYKLKKNLFINGIGSIKLTVHESDASPTLQFMCMKNIKPAGWIKCVGKRIKKDDQLSICDYEYETSYKNFEPLDRNTVASPLIMAFDIEVNSTNPNIAPQHGVPGDKVFQISCVFCRNGEKEENYEKYILTLAKNKKGEQIELIQEDVGNDVEIRLYDNEGDLLCGFRDIIYEKNPQILCGYNIFSFDIPYMYNRAKITATVSLFDQLSFIEGIHAKEMEISWSSSAYKNQHFIYLDAPGRIWVDMLPIIQRDYKLENYKLKTVSDFFLGQTKDPLTHKGIFKCYRMFTPKSLSIVAKYCVKDSELVVKLFEKLQIWIGLCEMANTCNTPVFDLFTRGQQLKIFSQVYKKCMDDAIVIDKDSFIVNENDHFTGAYVFTPVPGLYDMVVSFDFSSLYPSTIIAYNIDYSTLVLDDSIPDDKCNIIEWEDHQNCKCEHTKIVKTSKVVMCQKNRFRFLKDTISPGIIPTLLKNLLDARKKTNNEMKKLKGMLETMSPEEKESTLRLITVLDKRQLSYKVSANSMYGGMGVKKGYLPFLPGAMCTTARGRQSIEKASKFLVENFGAKLIYGDTDSCYISFPQFQEAKFARDLDTFCRQIEDETSNLFPKPMKFAYEEAIYWRYLILSKKRYMALKCDLDGHVKDKIEKRGVLLSRRDNSSYSRDFYSKLIMKAFYKGSFEEANYIITDELNKLAANCLSPKELSISKSVGDIKDYKIKPLPEVHEKLIKRLQDLNIYDESANLDMVLEIFKAFVTKEEGFDVYSYSNQLEYQIVMEYVGKALPSQVQLAEKMRRRGQPVSAGERLAYVVVQSDNIKDKLFEKIEDLDYYKENSSYIKIDYLYYTKLMINPVDEVLKAVYTKDDVFKKIYKYRENYFKVVKQLNDLFSPKIAFVDDNDESLDKDKKKKGSRKTKK